MTARAAATATESGRRPPNRPLGAARAPTGTFANVNAPSDSSNSHTPTTSSDSRSDGYDEFGLFHENIAEFDLDVDTDPTVERISVDVVAGRQVSLLKWGGDAPELVFVHGGAQNAHTWDTVALALGRPAVAVDLPGHGHSSWRTDGGYSPANLADDIAVAIAAHAPDARLVVGMSLGGLTSMLLATRHPELVRSLVMVDITPGVNGAKAKAIIDFVNGPQSFQSFDDLLARTIEFNPTRSVSSLRRGILHNAHQIADGSWEWNYDRTNRHDAGPSDTTNGTAGNAASGPESDTAAGMPESGVVAEGETRNPLWDDFAAIACPLTLVRGSLSPVVDDADVAEARRLQPDIQVELIDGAGHSIQGDKPVELAKLIEAKLNSAE